jgi:hypothetical protein
MKQEIDLISVYSYWQVHMKHGKKTHYLGTSRLDKGESEADAKRRITEQYKRQIKHIKEAK